MKKQEIIQVYSAFFLCRLQEQSFWRITMKKNVNEIARALSMVTQLGISMLAPVVLCAFVGTWLDDRFGWSVTAVLLVLGVMAGARNTWILVKNVIRSDRKEKIENEKKSK